MTIVKKSMSRGRKKGGGGGAVATHTLTTVCAGSGDGTITGTGIACPGDCSQEFTEGTAVELTAGAGGGSVFDGWSGDGTGDGSVRTVIMNAPKTVTATFTSTEGAEEIAGTGAILKEDLATLEDPTDITLWQGKKDCFPPDEWDASDTQITRLSVDPDPHTKVGGGTSTHYRRTKQLETSLANPVVGTPATVDLVSAGDLPSSGRGGAFDECMVSILGLRSFTYTGKAGNTLTGCGNWTGTSGGTSFNAGDAVRVQSCHDAGVPNSSTRTQLTKNTSTEGQTWYLLTEGNDYILYMSIRFEDPTTLIDDSAAYGRNQVLQYKEYPNSGGGLPSANPVFAMTEHRTKLRVNFKGVLTEEIPLDRSPGWIRFAFAWRMKVSAAEGKFRMWADLDGSGLMLPITPLRTLSTMANATGKSNISFGSYGRLTCPAQTRDYANIQLCEFTGFGP